MLLSGVLNVRFDAAVDLSADGRGAAWSVSYVVDVADVKREREQIPATSVWTRAYYNNALAGVLCLLLGCYEQWHTVPEEGVPGARAAVSAPPGWAAGAALPFSCLVPSSMV